MHRFCIFVPKKKIELDGSGTEGVILQNSDYLQLHCGGMLWREQVKNKSFIKQASNDSRYVVTSGEGIHTNYAQDLLEIGLGNKKNILLPYGQYSAVIWDFRKDLIYLFSDPAGIRSLFYLEMKSGYLISTSIRFIITIAGIEVVQRDIEVEQFLFRYGYTPPGKTVFPKIKEVLTGTVEIASLKHPDKQYKAINSKIAKINHSSCHEDDLYSIFMEVLERQVNNRSRIGVLLGGFDSALVASALTKMGVEIQTYSFNYDNKTYNQPYVQELAKYLGIRHHWIKVDSNIIGNYLSQYSYFFNSPCIWLGYVLQSVHLCNVMSDMGLEGCFSGDGCDTAFMGYPSTHRRGGVYKKIPLLPPWIVSLLLYLGECLDLELFTGHINRVIKSLLRASEFPVSRRPVRSFQIFDPTSYESLTGEKYVNRAGMEAIINEFEDTLSGLSFERQMYQAKTRFSPNRMKMVLSTDISGLCIESPYMHPLLVRFVKALPDKMLRTDLPSAPKEGKELLIRMASKHNLLPEYIIKQPKVAAVKSPIDEWFDSELRNFIETHLDNLPFKPNKRYLNSLLSDLAIEKLYKKYFSNDGVVSFASSLLITYASFFKQN